MFLPTPNVVIASSRKKTSPSSQTASKPFSARGNETGMFHALRTNAVLGFHPLGHRDGLNGSYCGRF